MHIQYIVHSLQKLLLYPGAHQKVRSYSKQKDLAFRQLQLWQKSFLIKIGIHIYILVDFSENSYLFLKIKDDAKQLDDFTL